MFQHRGRFAAVVLGFLFLGPLAAHAQTGTREIVRQHLQGPSGADVLRYGLNNWDRSIPGARAKAMGGAGLAVLQGADGASLNPALWAFLPAPTLSAETRYRMGGATSQRNPGSIQSPDGSSYPTRNYRPNVTNNYTYNDLSYGMPILFFGRRAGLGLTYRRMIDMRNGDESRFVVQSPFGSADFGAGSQFKGGLDAISPSLGVALNPRLAVGLTANFMTGQIRENGDEGVTVFGQVVSRGSVYLDQDMSGKSLDLGGLYRPTDNLDLAATIQLGHSIDFTNGRDSRESLPDPSAQNPPRIIIERDLLDHTLDVPTMIGLGASWRMFDRKVLLAADYWMRPWDKAEYTRRAFATTTLFPDSNLLSTTVTTITPLSGEVTRDANLRDTSHLRLGLEWMAVGTGREGVSIPVRIGFRSEPLAVASIDTLGYYLVADSINKVAANLSLPVSQRKETIRELVDQIYQTGASLLAGGDMTQTVITLGTGIKVDAFSIDVALSRSSYTVERLFLGSFSDPSLNRRTQSAREKRSLTEFSITAGLRF